MRALCGAIITAGALIGLGLFALGMGTRYSTYAVHTTVGGPVDLDKSQVWFQHLDNPMKLVLILLIVSVVVGFATAFLGLMFHHHRRHHELLHLQNQHAGVPPRATV